MPDTATLRAWHRRNEYGQVIEALEAGRDSLGPEQELLLGLSYAMSGDIDRAKSLLNLATQNMAESLPWRSDLGLSHLLQGDIGGAAAILEPITTDRYASAVDFSRLAAVRLAQQHEDEAASLYREAIEREPGRVHWYHNLAGVLVRLQKLEEALQQYELALQLEPEFKNSLEARRELLLALERTEQLVEELEQQLDEEPQDYKLRQLLARALLRDQRFTDAIKCLAKGLEKIDELLALKESDPQDFADKQEAQIALRLTLAEFWSQRSRHGRSHELLTKVQQLQDEESPDILCARVSSLIEMRRYDESSELLDELAEKYPDNNRAKILRSQLLCEQGSYPEAEELLRRLLEIYPGNAAVLCNLGQTLLWTGKLEESARCFEQASHINPMALAQMVRTRKLPGTPEAVRQMEEIADNLLVAEEPRATMAFALAEIHDRRDEPGEAFRFLEQGNRLLARQLDYMPARFSERVDRTIAVFTRDYFKQLAAIRPGDRTPVFVVGMPRSGTTLTEQVLAAHPRVFGAGELELLPTMTRLVRRVLKSRQAYPENVTKLTPELREEAARYYLYGLQQYDEEHQWVIDKLPHNFVNLGLIQSVLPGAKIIHVQRDPRAIALSNFQQNFKARHGGMGFAFELEHIALQINDYHRLMAHWREVLPSPMLEIRYESLVADLEGIGRALLDHLGLEWDESLRDFHTSERAVRTASVSQVREPIYDSSVQKWRRYEEFLGPLLEQLDPAVLEGWP